MHDGTRGRERKKRAEPRFRFREVLQSFKTGKLSKRGPSYKTYPYSSTLAKQCQREIGLELELGFLLKTKEVIRREKENGNERREREGFGVHAQSNRRENGIVTRVDRLRGSA
jgi:hypothetical protein